MQAACNGNPLLKKRKPTDLELFEHVAQMVILVGHGCELTQASPQRLILLGQMLQDVLRGGQELCVGCG